MAKIENELQFEAVNARIEELLKVVDNKTPSYDKQLMELDLLANLVADYEEVYFPINKPTLIEILKLRMFELGLTQLKLSELLGVSPSRISEYLSGKNEPTLKVAREMCRKLNIDAEVVLGV
jgi:HTH-type transcriptional regulator / antitoxin HigA